MKIKKLKGGHGIFITKDAICVDTTKLDGRIYQCSHSLLSEDGISFYKGKMIHLDFNYDNVIKYSVE